MVTFQTPAYSLLGIAFPGPTVTRYRQIVAYTGPDRIDPVIFYEVRREDSDRMLQRFLQQHLTWEISTHWSRIRFDRYLKERMREALPALHFRESPQGWLRIFPHPKRTSSALTLDHHAYVPQRSPNPSLH